MKNSSLNLGSIFFYLFTAFCLVPLWGLTVPPLSGSIVDEAQILTPSEKGQIEVELKTLRDTSQVQMAVLTLKSLEGIPIDYFSIQVAEKWKLGEKKTDKGLILLIAPNDRKVRIEVGYGLEGIIPDATAKKILRMSGTPFFKQGLWARGISETILKIAERVKDPSQALESPVVETEPKLRNGIQLLVMLLFVIFLVFISSLNGRRYGGRSRWGGGGGFGGGGFGGGGGGFRGGGGFGGGGGGFGGGGSSDSW